MSVPDLIEAATTLYTNARDNAEIVAALTEFGYEREPGPEDDAGDYDDGLALVADVTRERSEFAAEEADEDEAVAAAAASSSWIRRCSVASLLVELSICVRSLAIS